MLALTPIELVGITCLVIILSLLAAVFVGTMAPRAPIEDPDELSAFARDHFVKWIMPDLNAEHCAELSSMLWYESMHRSAKSDEYVEVAYHNINVWRRYAAYCKSCARCGTPCPEEFEEFVRRTLQIIPTNNENGNDNEH